MSTKLSAMVKRSKKLNYNAQYRRFVEEMCTSPEAITRVQCAASDHIPKKFLRQMLRVEENLDVFRTLLLNPRLSVKDISDSIWARPHMFKHVENDQEIINCTQGKKT